MSPALTLAPDEVHLWYVLPDTIVDQALLDRYDALLTTAERTRRDRYMFDRNRREYLLTRALVRATLSRYADVAPEAWTFRDNEWGRPAIDAVAHAEHASLCFNLSNTEGLIACAVASRREIGVDVENVERAGATVGIADRFFSPREVEALRAVPEAARRDRFFDYWTLKEAYIKARGMGLAIPLDHFSFLLEQPGPVKVAFEPELDDDASTWQFEQLALTPNHRTALAIRRSGEEVRVVVRETVPLGDG